MSELPEIQSSSVLIMKRGVPVVDVAAEGCAPSTRFQIASVSKQFTAAAVLRLAERGALGLDDPVGRRIGSCPRSWRDVTLHHLLSHTSGVGHWHDYPMIDLIRWVEPAELLETFQQLPPVFAPGTGWHYSSPGYVLLAHVVQRAANAPYRDVLTREIFGPLGMRDTFAGSSAGRKHVARGYGRDGLPAAAFELDVVGMGARDVWSTTHDLLVWVDGLRAGRLLGERYRTLMLTERAPTGAGA
jgi:CubicO group peptidase (beta-lactamase class C family)